MNLKYIFEFHRQMAAPIENIGMQFFETVSRKGEIVFTTPCREWDSTRLPGYHRNTSTGTVSVVGMRKFRILSREQTGPKASARILNELRQTNYATPNPLIHAIPVSIPPYFNLHDSFFFNSNDISF